MESNIVAAVRDIFVIVASGVFAAAGITAIVVVVKLYRPLQETVHNAAATSRNFRQLSGDLAAVSEETAGNVAQTSRNAVTISETLKEGSEDLSETVRAAREAATNVAATASTIGTIAKTVNRFSSLGASGVGTASGVGPLLRLLRTAFGGSGRGDNSGGKQGA